LVAGEQARQWTVLFELALDGVISVEDHSFYLAIMEMDR
jgi:hypothetical protein